MSDLTEETPEMALARVHQQLAEVIEQRDAAENRFVKMRQENSEQEDEIARMTREIDTRKAMFADLQQEYEAAKPYIHSQTWKQQRDERLAENDTLADKDLDGLTIGFICGVIITAAIALYIQWQ